VTYDHIILLGPADAGYVPIPSEMPGALIEPLYVTDPFEADIAAGRRVNGSSPRGPSRRSSCTSELRRVDRGTRSRAYDPAMTHVSLVTIIVDDYDGDPAAVWSTASTGNELLNRVEALPGFGEQKAKIFVALLGKQLGVRPPGWREAAGAFGSDEACMSVADIHDAESLGKVRSYKQSLKAAAKAKS